MRALEPAATARIWPLYAGGFLGPFGGAMVVPMLPELRDGLHTTLAVAAWSLTVYMIPFASLMIVSGTLAERWGRRRTVQLAYLSYALASIGCVVSTGPAGFLAGRAVQGAANAFTTPILLAAISDQVDGSQLGRALGRYGSLQAAGQAFAPLVGGLAAAINWRWAFVVTVIAAVGLAVQPPSDAPPLPIDNSRDRWRALANSRLALACLVAALLYLTSLGLTTLSALLAGDRFGLGPDQRGLVVAAFGAAGLVGGGAIGRGLNRLGVRRFGVLSGLALGAAAALAGWSPALPVLIGALVLGGAAGTAGRVAVNSMAVRSTPGNRGGAASMTLAWQFIGGALAPVLLIPIYRQHDLVSLLAAGASCLLAALALALAPGRLLPAS
jgi:MFS transporter, ACDE family, multidrug resistance protein